MSAIYLVKNQVYHAWTKHINVRFHFFSEEGDLVLETIHTKENPTDNLPRWFRELSSTIVRT